MGHETIATPNLDRLARESVTFTRGYVPTALCRPSLASIITGLYPSQHGIVGNDPAIPADIKGNPRLDKNYLDLCEQLISRIDRCETLPEVLSKNGYRTFQTGKWWEGSYQRGGFEKGMTHGEPTKGGRHGDEGLKISRQGNQPIFDFIESAGDDPFFIWHAPFLPHTPHNPPERLLTKYRAEGRPERLAKYYAMCEWFDETCGDIIDYVDEKGLAEKTIIVYVTDNGWIQTTSQSDVPENWSRPFAPRSKQSCYEGGVRTPIMFRWTKHLQARMDKETLVSSIDLMPTILGLCGIETATIESHQNLPGSNLTEVLRGKTLERDQVYGEGFAHDVVDIEHPEESRLYRWIIKGDWKLIVFDNGVVSRYPEVHAPLGRAPELYNLESDPHEVNNLAKEQPERVNQLRQLIDEQTKRLQLVETPPQESLPY